jgi:hypothetical protein
VPEQGRERPLPDGYQATLRKGIAALEQVDALIVRTGRDDPEQLLELRDVRGLKGRLGEMEPEDWRQGRVLTTLSPLDVGVLMRCETAYGDQPIRDAVRELRIFLSTYLEL